MEGSWISGLLSTETGRFYLNLLILIAGGTVGVLIFRRWSVRAPRVVFEAKRLRRRGEHLEAGELLMSVGLWEGALESFSAINYFRRMADVYLKMGQPKRAALMYEKDGDARSAVDAYLAARANDAIIDLAERTQKFAEIAQYLESRSQFELAAEVWLRGRDLESCAKAYGYAKQYVKAAETLIRSLKYGAAQKVPAPVLKSIAAYYHLAGMKGEAKKYLAQSEAAVGAEAELGEMQLVASGSGASVNSGMERNEPSRAAFLYEQQGELELAAEMYARANQYENAGRLYERLNNLPYALQCYETGQNTDKAVEIASRLKEWLKAAIQLMKAEKWVEAIEFLKRIPQESSDYGEAVKLLAQCNFKLGNFSISRALYKEYETRFARSGADKLNSIYQQAVAAEKQSDYNEAFEDLQKLFDANYKRNDVAERISRIKSELKQSRAFVDSSGIQARGARYQLEKEIGRGGMAVVYRATDTVLGRPVALKILADVYKRNNQAVDIFLREARATALLSHPNIVTVYDAGKENDNYYIAMEFIEGSTLKSLIRKKRLKSEKLVHYLTQLVDGLHFAHEHKIVHRDMTTNNIMIDKNDSVKIMDFGLAKILEKMQAEQSLIGGTPSYMAPEQILGKALDRRTDIYAFGVCLFELLTGRLPYPNGDTSYHHLHTPVPKIKEITPDAPDFLCEIAERCLLKKPEERFQSLMELRPLLHRS